MIDEKKGGAPGYATAQILQYLLVINVIRCNYENLRSNVGSTTAHLISMKIFIWPTLQL